MRFWGALLGFVLIGAAFGFGIKSSVYAVNHTEPVPLPELGSDTYLGVIGGLYLNGSNEIPPAYLIEVDAAISQLENDGNIQMICNGMSNMAHTCGEMKDRMVTANVNPAVDVINCGRPGRPIQAFDGSSPSQYYTQCKFDSNPNTGAVDVVVFFNAWGNPSGNFSPYLNTMTNAVRDVYNNINQVFPNVKLIYFVSREYAPPWASSLNPNPYAYQDGFAFRNIIQERINGTLSGAPVIWGPYQYDESWPDSYFRVPDGVHLSDEGLAVAGQLWLDFFMAQPWFADGDPLPTATPAPSNTPLPTDTPGTPTATSEPANTPQPTNTPTVTPTLEPTATGGAATPTPVCPPWAPPDCWATSTPRPTRARGGW